MDKKWFFLLSLLSFSASAQDPSETEQKKTNLAAVPFAFYTESLEFALGFSGVATGHLQPQMSIFATALATSNKSSLVFLAVDNMMLPGVDRLFLGAEYGRGRFTNSKYYIPGNPGFPDQPPGDNDSSKDNFILGVSDEIQAKFSLNYVLPLGDAKNSPMVALRRAGVIPGKKSEHSGSYSWNPVNSGITRLEVEPFLHEIDFRDIDIGDEPNKAAGVKFTYDHDGRNSAQLPTSGSRQTLTYTKDWGSQERTPWSKWTFEYSHFYSFGSSESAKQNVLAFNFWTADIPSWNDSSDINGQQRFNRPAWFEAVTLGGWDRLRGYENDRFYDRSAISYSLEYRYVPKWEPLKTLPGFSYYSIPWWQWVAFVDAGRVAPDYNLKNLHKDMKASVGAGMRFNVEGVLVRLDFAASDEGNQFRVFINQPF